MTQNPQYSELYEIICVKKIFTTWQVVVLVTLFCLDFVTDRNNYFLFSKDFILFVRDKALCDILIVSEQQKCPSSITKRHK